MAFKETRLFEWLTIGLSAASFIIVLKLLFLGPFKVPGLSNVAAMI